ncbi:hypothetical protein [Leptospira interrogans]|nr:hypothetical protein [Leptospira interrogans]
MKGTFEGDFTISRIALCGGSHILQLILKLCEVPEKGKVFPKHDP